jgi:hypothetical protein
VEQQYSSYILLYATENLEFEQCYFLKKATSSAVPNEHIATFVSNRKIAKCTAQVMYKLKFSECALASELLPYL